MAKREKGGFNNFMSDEATLKDMVREHERHKNRTASQRAFIATLLAEQASKADPSDPIYAARVYSGLLTGCVTPEDVFPIVKTNWPVINRAYGGELG